MSHINYPAKVLFKSANPIITMLIGLLWFHKSYPVRWVALSPPTLSPCSYGSIKATP